MEYALLQAVILPLTTSTSRLHYWKKIQVLHLQCGLHLQFLLYTTILIINAALSGTVEEHYPWTTQFGEFGFLTGWFSITICNNDLCFIYNLGTLLKTIHDSHIPSSIRRRTKHQHHLGSEQTSVVESSALTNYVNAKSGLYFALYLLFAMGMLGTVLATNLIEFFVFFEIMLIPGFFLVALWGAGQRRKIGLMFLFWTHAGAVVLLLGFLMIGLTVGSFDFADINESEIPQDIAMLSAVAIALGLGVKASSLYVPHLASICPRCCTNTN